MTELSRLSEWLRALLPALPGAARSDSAAETANDDAPLSETRDGAKPAPVYIAPKRRDGRSDGR
ncbi:hypothetical protein [Lysobacter antibioticus]|uniref:hypothetical protein n=1 Tax=Lysobacter antibioticus TaxID=84531 RepID=UPI0003477700|nr:hypothetical protein [Lysobacter antibioticus]